MSTIRGEHPMSWADHHSPVGQESSFLATVDRYGVSSGTQRLVKCDHCDRFWMVRIDVGAWKRHFERINL